MNTEVAIVIILLFMVGLVSYITGHGTGRDYLQNEAIEHNAAEWRIDAKTGDKEFVWLTCEEK